MKLLFVDESEGFEKKNRVHFVLFGTIVDSSEMFSLEREIANFRKKFLGGKNLKYLRGYKTLKFERKWKLSEKLYKTIGKKFDLKLVSAILGSRSSKDANKKSYVNALNFLIERYFFYLVENDDKGIIVIDTLATGHQSYIREQFQRIIVNGGKWEGRYKDRIFPIAFFGDDKHSNIIQLTDVFCAGLHAALQQFVEGNEEDELKGNEDVLVNYNSFLPLYWDFFRKFAGRISGGGIKFWK